MLNRARTAGLALFALLMIGAEACSSGGRQDYKGSGDPTADAANILARYKATPAADAQLNIRVKPVKGDALNFQLHLWCASDGRVRLIASKLDVDFCSALLKPDGGYIVVAPRAHLAATGTFDDNDLADFSPLLTQSALISNEMRNGPLPATSPWNAGTNGHFPTLISANAARVSTVVEWDPSTGLVTAKYLVRGIFEGHVTPVAIAYSHERDFDGLLRPTLATVTVAGTVGTTNAPNASYAWPPTDATTITIGLKRFEGLGTISGERMRLDIPADAKTVPLDELLKHLGD